MRIELSVHDADAGVRDIVVAAPDGVRFGAVREAITAHLPAASPDWVGGRRIGPDAVLGRAPLLAGAVLRAAPTSDPADSPDQHRLAVVCGRDAGRFVQVGGAAVRIGRDRGCDLALTDPRVSRRHAVLRVGAGRLVLRDAGSTHGTWVNDRYAAGRVLRRGDLIRVGDTFLMATATRHRAGTTRAGPDGTLIVLPTHAPGLVPAGRVVEWPRADGAATVVRVQWAVTLLPAVAGVGLAWATHSLPFLLIAVLSPVAMLGSAFGERWRARRGLRRHDRRHRAELDAARREMAAAVGNETRLRRAAHPDPSTLATIAEHRSSRLWERHRRDPGLLRVRTGLADADSAVLVSRDGVTAPAVTLRAVPHLLDLGGGPVGILGPRQVRHGIARWIVTQLVTFVSPLDLEVALLVDDDPERWRWAHWLPHVREPIAATPDAASALVDLLAERSERTSAATDRARPRHLLVVVGDGVDHAAARRLVTLLEHRDPAALTAICTGVSAAALPVPAAQTVRVAGDTGTAALVTAAGPDPSAGPHRRERATRVTADVVDASWAARLARSLAPLRDGRVEADSALPSHCTLTGVYANAGSLASAIGDAGFTAHLVTAFWTKSAGGAATVLGMTANGTLGVDLASDGPHLLVAGTTGSGKSEFLQTLVAGLALHQPPEHLTVLLVDYKGGAALADCARLPHTVGVITDLDPRLTARVLASLDSEVRRRERLFADAGVASLDEYRRGGRTLPRLVLVVDEFATLAEEFAGFVPGLVSIAQRGRSLGLHLVLATQRPAGVVSAEIRANVSMRVCLRVTGAGDSNDVIDSPVAATIARRLPGRAYLRAGTDLVAFQTARSGAPVECADPPIVVSDLDPCSRADTDVGAGDGSSQLVELVAAIGRAAGSRPPPRRPWLPPLPERIGLDDLDGLARPGSAIDADDGRRAVPGGPSARPAAVPIGVLDLPAEQRRTLLTIDLESGGGVLVAGAAGSGRSGALRTIAMATALARRPEELHVHALGAGGPAGLSALNGLPHLGTLLTPRDGFATAAALVARLEALFAARRGTGTDHARILLLVDDWESIVDESTEHDGGRTAHRLLGLFADAAAAGATVVIAGGRAVLAGRVIGHARTRLILGLGDGADYTMIGIDARTAPPRLPGRGLLVPPSGDAAEFQLASPRRLTTPGRQVAAALRLRPLPRRIELDDVTPRTIPVDPLGNGDRRDDRSGDRSHAAAARLVLGVGGDEAAPVTVDPFVSRSGMVIAGPPRSGRSSALIALLHQWSGGGGVVAARRRSPLLDASRRHGWPVLTPESERVDVADALASARLLLIDDAEQLSDTELETALTHWLRTGGAPAQPSGGSGTDESGAAGRRAVVAAGRTDALVIAYRGLGAELRQARCGVLLQPGPVDGELLGVSLPRVRPTPIPGRGVLVPDPAWWPGRSGADPMLVQLAFSPCADGCVVTSDVDVRVGSGAKVSVDSGAAGGADGAVATPPCADTDDR